MRGHYVYRQNTGAYKPEGSKRFIRFGVKGGADIIGVIGAGEKRGTFLAVECKFGKNKTSDDQLAFGEKITSHGGVYIVAYSVDDLVSNGL